MIYTSHRFADDELDQEFGGGGDHNPFETQVVDLDEVVDEEGEIEADDGILEPKAAGLFDGGDLDEETRRELEAAALDIGAEIHEAFDDKDKRKRKRRKVDETQSKGLLDMKQVL